MNNNITSGPTGISGHPGITGVPSKAWLRIIKIRKMLKLWEDDIL